MSTTKLMALMGASALAMGAGGARAADTPATPYVQVYGGGSSLIAPFIRQFNDCYGVKVPLERRANTTQTRPDFNFPGTAAGTQVQDCSKDGLITDKDAQGNATPGGNEDLSLTLHFTSIGSGRGILGFYRNLSDPAWASTAPTNFPSSYPGWHYTMSDAPLGTADVATYNNGGDSAGGQAVKVEAAGVTTPRTGYRVNPNANYGPMVQFPLLVAPIAITYSPVYKKVFNTADGTTKSYSFHIKDTFVRADGSGGLRLDRQTYCKIFNGQITNWNNADIARLNGAPFKTVKTGSVSTKVYDQTFLADQNDPDKANFSLPIQIAGRSDGSGTTNIFSRHLAAVCGTAELNSGTTNAFPDAADNLPAAIVGGVYNKSSDQITTAEVVGKFTVADGSDGLSKLIAFRKAPDSTTTTIVQGRIGYIGPDYALPFDSVGFGLATASLRNTPPSVTTGGFYSPTVASAYAAYTNYLPPQSSSSGSYDPTITANGSRNDPAAWVQPASKTASIASPPASKYPIVGTTQLLAYTCYADGVVVRNANGTATTSPATIVAAGNAGKDNIGYKVNSWMFWYNKRALAGSNAAGFKGILPSNGYSSLPVAFKNAITDTFVKPTTTGTNPTNALQLWISPKSDADTLGSTQKPIASQHFTHNPRCDAVPGAPLLTQ